MLLINASNLHSGGGVQVATSVIFELTQIPKLPLPLTVWASDEVDANLRKIGCDLTALPSYEVVNSHGVTLMISRLHRRLQNFEVVFTIFGPLYVWGLRGVNIVGFAQAWIIYPDNEIDAAMGWRKRGFNRLKFKLQSVFFKHADQLVVELEHVRTGLLDKGIGNVSTLHVVRNSLSALYLAPESFQPVNLPATDADIKLGFVGRNYAHKNSTIFPRIINILRQEYDMNASIYVTFTDEEWSECSAEFRELVINVGPLFASQCPTFYKSMDGVVFPSLLECFSATPLEAMAMEKPLFASDRLFNRDICHEHAHYFDPLLPASAAQVIAKLFLNGGPNPKALSAARKHAINFSNPKQRTEQYLSLLVKAAGSHKIDLKGI
jgi:glycosyltransferase involved in cell wall biosynthesis